jgi:uncharacterized protein
MVPTLAAAGWDTRLISYRNDEDAPSSGHYLLGGEWEDLAAVIDDLVAGGARRILLIGWSMGGNICASYLRHRGRFAGDAEVVGLMLDAPALSWRDVLTHVARQHRLPSALVPATLALGQLTVGIDWSVLDHVAEASHLDEVPVLIVHGDDDDLVPIDIPTHLAERLDDARLELFPGGSHCRSLNADPERYLGLLAGLLADLDGSRVPGVEAVAGTSWVTARTDTVTEVDGRLTPTGVTSWHHAHWSPRTMASAPVAIQACTTLTTGRGRPA